MTTAEMTPPVDLSCALRIVEEMQPVTESSIIPLLQRLQDSYGYLRGDIILEVCAQTGLPASRVFGVATFYDQFYLAPRGKHIVRCCLGTACHVRGAARLVNQVAEELSVAPGDTTADGLFTLETVNCIGACALGPVIVLDGVYHDHMTAGKLSRVIKSVRAADSESSPDA